jgi:hypothetical protein
LKIPLKLKIAKEVVSKEAQCPYCKHTVDRASAVNETGEMAQPKPGDISVCIRCANWNVYDSDMQLRDMSEEEIAALPQDIFSQLTVVGRSVVFANKAVKEREKGKRKEWKQKK